MLLECADCHFDQTLFGRNCRDCHGISEWTITGFHHPPEERGNRDKCHREPQSHDYEEFRTGIIAVLSPMNGNNCPCVINSGCFAGISDFGLGRQVNRRAHLSLFWSINSNGGRYCKKIPQTRGCAWGGGWFNHALLRLTGRQCLGTARNNN